MKNYPLYKCLIYSEDNLFPETDVTNCIGDLEMLEVVLSRDKVSGVMPEVSFPMEFVLKARDLLKALFNRYGLYARARFKVEQREDFGIGYAVVKDAPLDFGTYKEYDNMVTIETTEAELLELINSEGKTKYEIFVDNEQESVKDSMIWDYQRMELRTCARYAVPVRWGIYPDSKTFLIPLNFYKSEIVPFSGVPTFKSQAENININSGFFFKPDRAATLKLRFKVLISGYAGGAKIFFHIAGRLGEDNRIFGSYEVRRENGFPELINDTLDISLKEGEELYAYLSSDVAIRDCQFGNLRSSSNDYGFDLEMKAQPTRKYLINVIDPQKLIQTYLDKMSGEKNYYTAEIQWRPEENYKTKIVAAESIRQMPNAKLYGSPNDFFDWMQVLGYEFECVGRTLVFKPRDQFFRRDVTAMNLKARELADLIVQADQTYAYTSVEIGYDKQDYEDTNGRCEANGTFCFTTGYITKKDNKLKLISPYRADSMGIEFLCQETDKKTTDNKSDNDVFFVALTDNADKTSYVEYREIEIVDKELGVRMFNAPYNPYFLVKYNESLISINTKKIKFKSTDMSRTASITGVLDADGIYSDLQVKNKLFEPIEYNFAAGHWQKIPTEELRDGLIHFEWEGKVLKGFIKQIRKNYAAETETTWVLWMVS